MILSGRLSCAHAITTFGWNSDTLVIRAETSKGRLKISEKLSASLLYAQPRWYLGNVLIELGKHDEGFAELRRAVTSDPTYLADFIKRADAVYQSAPAAVLQAVQPQSSTVRLALAQHFIKQEQISAAMELFRSGGGLSDKDRDALLSALLTAGKFAEGHEVWAIKYWRQ